MYVLSNLTTVYQMLYLCYAHFTFCYREKVIYDKIPCRSRVAYYGVFDGHAGPKASKFTAENLHNNIKDRLPKGQCNVVDLCVVCQKSIEETLLV